MISTPDNKILVLMFTTTVVIKQRSDFVCGTIYLFVKLKFK